LTIAVISFTEDSPPLRQTSGPASAAGHWAMPPASLLRRTGRRG
jgi:hypothetical protein